jgi:branched-chain amino acid transport system ATP-binding protein
MSWSSTNFLSGSAKDIASNQRVAASYLGFQHEGASGI